MLSPRQQRRSNTHSYGWWWFAFSRGLRDGFAMSLFTERTGLPVTAIQKPLQEAEARGLIERSLAHVKPTERGFDFLSDLQQLFL